MQRHVTIALTCAATAVAGLLAFHALRGPESQRTQHGSSNGSAAVVADNSTAPKSRQTASMTQVHKEVGKAFTMFRTAELRPAGDPNEWIQSLIPLSESGDANASYEIYLAILDCQQYIRDSSEKELAFAKSIGASPAYIETMARKLKECEVLDPRFFTAGGDWLKKAADQGSIEAQVAYANNPDAVIGPEAKNDSEEAADWRRNAESYLNEAMRKGSVDAISGLSNLYLSGVAGTKDPAMAYAMQLALKRINPAYASDKYIDAIGRQLSDAQVERAKLASQEVFNLTIQ